MNDNKIKGIGGFLLVIILWYIFATLFGAKIIIKNCNELIYYMPWNEGKIGFIKFYYCIILILNFINIILLLFEKNKNTITFTINYITAKIIFDIILFIVFNEILYSGPNIIVSIIISTFIQYGIICYFKKSVRVHNTYCESDINKEENKNDNKYNNVKNSNNYTNDCKDEKYECFNKQDDLQKIDNDEVKTIFYKYNKEDKINENTKKNLKQNRDSYIDAEIGKAFQIFDMTQEHSFSEIRKRYHILIKIYDPERNNDDEESLQYAIRKTKEINEAYDALVGYYMDK